MKLNYCICGAGWADVYLEIDGSSISLNPNDTSEPLIKLLHCIITLITKDSEKCISFLTDEEPRINNWVITKIDNENINIRIDCGDECFDENCNIFEFAKELKISIDSILKKYGFIGYIDTWQNSDFPIGSYLRLCNILNKTDFIRLNTENTSKGIFCSNIEDEINVIVKYVLT